VGARCSLPRPPLWPVVDSFLFGTAQSAAASQLRHCPQPAAAVLMGPTALSTSVALASPPCHLASVAAPHSCCLPACDSRRRPAAGHGLG